MIRPCLSKALVNQDGLHQHAEKSGEDSLGISLATGISSDQRPQQTLGDEGGEEGELQAELLPPTSGRVTLSNVSERKDNMRLGLSLATNPKDNSFLVRATCPSLSPSPNPPAPWTLLPHGTSSWDQERHGVTMSSHALSLYPPGCCPHTPLC